MVSSETRGHYEVTEYKSALRRAIHDLRMHAPQREHLKIDIRVLEALHANLSYYMSGGS